MSRGTGTKGSLVGYAQATWTSPLKDRTPFPPFNIYDNEEKLRLKTTYQAREEAEVECQRLNLGRLQKVLSERESMTAL